jgi:single-strand DNA-binding protein
MVAKLTLVGNLGLEPEIRYSNDGKPVVSCRVASNYRRRDAETRDWVDATNWYRVTTFGRLAERLAEQANDGRLTKGTRIIAFGRLEASAYLDRNNQPQPSLDVVADDVLLADARRETDEPADYSAPSSRGAPSFRSGRSAGSGREPQAGAEHEPDLEDLPF